LWALRAQLARRAASGEISRLRALLDAVPDQALVWLDASGCVSHWNAAARRLHGFLEAEAIGQHYALLFSPDERQARVAENELESAARGVPCVHRGTRLHRDGSPRQVQTSLTALRDAAGRLVGFSVVESDLRKPLEQEQALAQARSTMAGVQKLVALGRLSEGIAHEFNNVVQVIRTSVALLQRQGPAEAQATDLLHMIERNADRAAGLSQHLLTLARRSPLAPVATDVNAVVAAVVTLLRQTLGENIVVEEQLDESLCWVFVDASALEAALLHVAADARDAMPAGGTLNFSTAEVMPMSDGTAPATPQRHSVAIRIQDEAVGDSDEEALQLVRGLLDHNAQVQVQRQGNRRTVTLYLPCRAG
jgi:PAS domain S-box-containing protein